MFDTNWELINGDDAHAIEVLNQASQANLIEAIVRFLCHHDTSEGPACGLCPTQGVLLELHRTGTLLLLTAPGVYRQSDVIVRRRDGEVFEPPPHQAVPGFMKGFEDELSDRWENSSAVDIAAFALWRINWVHPFKNGNGRTARAFAYTCVCLKYGFMLPGAETLIDLIMKNRDEYEAALAEADASYASAGTPELARMSAYVEGLLVRQLTSLGPSAGPA